jgi:hypothetical protein
VKTLVKYLLLFPLAVLPLAAQPASFDFGTPVVLSPVQAPGTWYPDRYPPRGFVSPEVAPDGKGDSLKESIAAADVQPGLNFQNTQGRKFDMPPNTLAVTIALYVPAAWGTENARKAGFWETVFDSSNAVGDYPIIEFQGPITSPPANGPSYQPNLGIPGFYGWNNITGHYDFIGFPTGFTYDSWVQLTITLVPGSHFVYTVGDPAHGGKTLASPLSDLNDAYVGNTILQGYNYAADYDIFWNGVGAPGAVQQRYFSNLNHGDSVIDITNDGSGPGNICVNVYAFDPSEEMVSCCTCPVTPNALNALSVNLDLIKNTLTSLPPTSVTVKLVATTVPASQTCDPTSTSGTTTVSALHAWGTTLHAGPGSFMVTETPFSAVSSIGISSDLATLTQTCRFIKFAGSGFGICTSCRLGGLGAVRQ